MEAKLTNVFQRNGEAFLKALNGTGPRLIINQGGQGSSKTFSILQAIYNYGTGVKEPEEATFCSYALPHLKQGVIRDFDKIIPSFGGNLGEVKSSPSQPAYHIGNLEINCYGVEGNLAMAHGPRRKILFINECNRKITYEVFDQLFSRSQITFLDFNPDQEFWLHDKVIPNFPHVLIKSTYLDNPYLPGNELRNILMKKDKPEFANWWRVYGLGELGKLEGAIFTNWRYLTKDETFPDYLPYSFGLDFGFNDPDAMVKTAIDHKRRIVYAEEKIYNSGNTFDQIKRLISDYCKNTDLITADCADARMINELSRFFNIHPINKKSMKVAEALKIMQGYEIVITENSYNLAKELSNYLWNDKKAGIPMKGFDHLIDAMRYAFMANTGQTEEYFGFSITGTNTEEEDD